MQRKYVIAGVAIRDRLDKTRLTTNKIQREREIRAKIGCVPWSSSHTFITKHTHMYNGRHGMIERQKDKAGRQAVRILKLLHFSFIELKTCQTEIEGDRKRVGGRERDKDTRRANDDTRTKE